MEIDRRRRAKQGLPEAPPPRTDAGCREILGVFSPRCGQPCGATTKGASGLCGTHLMQRAQTKRHQPVAHD